jgi:hypothetical protein
MISNERIQADILDRLLQRMLEGKDAAGDPAWETGAASAQIRPLLDTAGSVRGLLSGQGPSPEFISVSERRLLRRNLEADIAAGGAAEIRPLMETAESVRKLLSAPSPAPAFITASENRLLWRIKPRTSTSARRAAPDSGVFRTSWLRTAVAAAIAVAVVSASGLSVASASTGTLPGDALYPVKRGLEEVSLTISMSAAGDVALLADYADTRVSEIEQLAVGERGDDLLAGLENYDETLTRLDAAMDQLPLDSKAVGLEDIQARLAWHAEALLALRDRLPEQAQEALIRAVEHSQTSRDRAEEIQINLGRENADPGQEQIPTKESVPGIDSPAATTTSADANPGAATQQPSGTPEPTNTIESTDIQDLTKTPKPSDTPKPSKTDKPSNTLKPEKTDKPTKIPDPSNTPKPEKTDKPTKIPDPANTPKPENTDKPTKDEE